MIFFQILIETKHTCLRPLFQKELILSYTYSQFLKIVLLTWYFMELINLRIEHFYFGFNLL